ncbi:MAG: hypothetical protein GY820_05565, partial [Gammaproteobacteria bacterium]|nr:hypothetical protein [Gammaproteobacteria bacterium]
MQRGVYFEEEYDGDEEGESEGAEAIRATPTRTHRPLWGMVMRVWVAMGYLRRERTGMILIMLKEGRRMHTRASKITINKIKVIRTITDKIIIGTSNNSKIGHQTSSASVSVFAMIAVLTCLNSIFN